MNRSPMMVEDREVPQKILPGYCCPVCGGVLNEAERLQEYTFTYILYRCSSPTCRKEYLEKWCVPIRDF